MSGSNIKNCYKIPRRRQNAGSGIVETIERNQTIAGTPSPLTKQPATNKNHVNHTKPQTTKAPAPKQPKAIEPNRTSGHRKKVHQQDVEIKQKAVKRRKEPEPSAPKHPRPSNDDPMELLDRIWKEMDEDDNRRKKSDDQQRDGSVSPTASPLFQAATPIPSSTSVSKLTRYELMNAPQDDTILRSFLNKPYLLERILAYKMQHSRVDTYEIMRKAAKLDECRQIEPDDSVDYGVPAYKEVEEPSTSGTNKLQKERKGPITPPGSPNHEQEDTAQSMEEDWHSGSVHSSPSNHSKHEPKNTPKEDEFSSRAELLQTFSRATNTPVERLEELIGTDLQNAIGRVAKSVLLNTLKDAIRNVNAPNSPKPTPLNRVIDSESAAVDSPVLTGNCEMAGSSTDSNASSSPLLPPPPSVPNLNVPPPEPEIKHNRPEPAKFDRPSSSTLQPNVNPSRPRPPFPSMRQEFRKPLNEAIPPHKLITSIPPPRLSVPPVKPFPLPDFSKPPPSVPLSAPSIQNLSIPPPVPSSIPTLSVPNLNVPNLSVPPPVPNLSVPPPSIRTPTIRNPSTYATNLPRLPSMNVPPPPYPIAGPPTQYARAPIPLMSIPTLDVPPPIQRPHFTPLNYRPEQQPTFNAPISNRPNYLPPPFRQPQRRP